MTTLAGKGRKIFMIALPTSDPLRMFLIDPFKGFQMILDTMVIVQESKSYQLPIAMKPHLAIFVLNSTECVIG